MKKSVISFSEIFLRMKVWWFVLFLPILFIYFNHPYSINLMILIQISSLHPTYVFLFDVCSLVKKVYY